MRTVSEYCSLSHIHESSHAIEPAGCSLQPGETLLLSLASRPAVRASRSPCQENSSHTAKASFSPAPAITGLGFRDFRYRFRTASPPSTQDLAQEAPYARDTLFPAREVQEVPSTIRSGLEGSGMHRRAVPMVETVQDSWCPPGLLPLSRTQLSPLDQPRASHSGTNFRRIASRWLKSS